MILRMCACQKHPKELEHGFGGEICWLRSPGQMSQKRAIVRVDLEEAYVSQHVGLLRLTEDTNSEFVYWFLVAKAGGRRHIGGIRIRRRKASV